MAEVLDQYQTVSDRSQGLYKDKGSKFISLAFPVDNELEIKEILELLRKEYHDARHYCYAWRLGVDGDNFRANDDGEPSGSAGLPILGQLRSFNISFALVVVVRYFGGTKLGVSGLIHAYKTATREALAQGRIITKTIDSELEIHFPYSQMNPVMRILDDEGAKINDQKFESICKFKISIRKSKQIIIKNRLQKLADVLLIEL